jgi:hypothetical protein
MHMLMFKGWFQQSKWWLCFRVYYQRAALLCVFCRRKDSMQRKILKKCFLFMVGSVCCAKWFTTGWQMFRWWWKRWNGGAEVAETTVTNLKGVWYTLYMYINFYGTILPVLHPSKLWHRHTTSTTIFLSNIQLDVRDSGIVKTRWKTEEWWTWST